MAMITRTSLSPFTDQSLTQASKSLLKALGIIVLSADQTDEPINYKNYYKQIYDEILAHSKDIPLPSYIKKTLDEISAAYAIGEVDERSFGDTSASSNSKYKSMTVFACEALPNATFKQSRQAIANLTRVFNIVSVDHPVVLIIRQEKQLFLSTCDRMNYIKDYRDKRERIGKVTTLRNINCIEPHPGHLQILDKIAENVKKSSNYEELYENWKKSFSIDIISDLFFDGYRKQYWNIIRYITGKSMVLNGTVWEERILDGDKPCEEIMKGFGRFQNPEKSVRDYVRKFMGRLVFIQFLQKKRWMGCPEGEIWGNGDMDFLQNLFAKSSYKDSFVDDVLEPLFNDINTKREGDLVTNSELGRIKVPYLNGGLFEPDEYDNVKFPLPADYIKDLLDFFASFNFTIDENAPEDAEISVDPEMLGRIFESLLEDNKEKGAYYTPKEIVQYMCREALIAYLQKDFNASDSKEGIRLFVTNHDVSNLKSSDVFCIDKKLRNVKICDPAIGSGAFPMGMLKELYDCRYAIRGSEEETPSEIKKDIIQNSIYGVDIERGAVDIARLRFWLALIIDEDTPHALPNMDFKIMQGNSLIPTFNGKYVNLTDGLRHVNSSKIRDAKKTLFTLQNEYYSTSGDEKKELLIRIKYQILEIVKLQMDFEFRAEVEKNAKTLDLFTKNPEKKQVKIDDEKLRIVGICMSLQKQLANNSHPLAERAEIPIPFFDWKIMFSNIFNQAEGLDGFNIIISNPPYIKERDNKKVFDTLADSDIKKKYHAGKMDYWYYFLHKAMELSNDNAVICFITSRYWIKSSGAKKLIEAIKANLTFKHVLDIGDLKVFDNVVGHHMVSLFEKPVSINPCHYIKIAEKIENIPLGVFEDERDIAQDILISDNNEINLEVLEKAKHSYILSDYCDVNQGVVEASDKISRKMYREKPDPDHYVGEGIFVLSPEEVSNLSLSEQEKMLLVPYVGDGDVGKYSIQPLHTRYLIYSDKQSKDKIENDAIYGNIKAHLDNMSDYITSSNKPYGIHRPRKKKSFTSEKIIGPSMFGTPCFAFDNAGYFCGMSYNIVTLKKEKEKEINLLYILGLLNSSFGKNWFYKNAKHRGVGVDVGVAKLREFPVPNSNYSEEVIKLVKAIIQKTTNGEKSDDLQVKLDLIIDKIYTPDTNEEI